MDGRPDHPDLLRNLQLSLSAARFVRRWNLVPAVKAFNRMMRRLVGFGHKLAVRGVKWRVDPSPEWYDHLMFQYWLWPVSRNPMSWERGIFSMVPMQNGCRVLDLCCGGGFFAHHFFSSRASKVISVDFDPEAIAHAKTNFHAPNVEYRCADIRTDMPDGIFDNIVWDAAIEHFTLEETAKLLLRHQASGSGATAYPERVYDRRKRRAGKSLSHHEYVVQIQRRSWPEFSSAVSPTFSCSRISHAMNSRIAIICIFMPPMASFRSILVGQTWCSCEPKRAPARRLRWL